MSFQAICSFTASSPDQLSLLLGDGVHVREECDGKNNRELKRLNIVFICFRMVFWVFSE